MFKRAYTSIFDKVINPKLIIVDFSYKLGFENLRQQLFESRLQYLKKYLDQQVFLTVGSKLGKQGDIFIISEKDV